MFLVSGVSLLLALSVGVVDSNYDGSYFTAAVYEHARLGNESQDSPSEIVQMNLAFYEKAARVASSKDADIIVFPEYGIFPPNLRNNLKKYLERIPDPQLESSNPCEERDNFANRPILLALSCLAKQNRIVVVANMGDIQPCDETVSDCREDGVLQYNTNVAFDKDGSLLARYHKEHLFFEFGMDLPRVKQDPTFRTDFGTFAMFVCFDIVFREMCEAAQNRSVDAVLLSTMWIDPVPTLMSVQFWQSFAMGNDATFMAANVQLPGYGSVGSGIFNGRNGALAYTFEPDGKSRLVVARVPRFRGRIPVSFENASVTIIGGDRDIPSLQEDGQSVPASCSTELLGEPKNIYKDYRCTEYENMTDYTFVKLNGSNGFLNACDHGMCCSLNYSTKGLNESFYFGVKNGTYNMYDRYNWCIENCLLVRCDSPDGKPCATFPLHSETVFDRLEITANFTTHTVYPSVMYSRMRLAPTTDWTYGVRPGEPTKRFIDFKSELAKPLLAAVLNGRCYDRDPPYRR